MTNQRRTFFQGISILSILLLFALIFFISLQSYEQFSNNTLYELQLAYSKQMAMLMDSLQQHIESIGSQLYYLSSSQKLRKSVSIEQNEKVFALRELWQFVSASPNLHSIHVFNKAKNIVYTTANDYAAASFEQFYDQAALELYQKRNSQNRFALHRRSMPDGQSLRKPNVISYLVYEIDYYGNIGDSALLLNFHYDWFRKTFSKLYEEDFLLLDEQNNIIDQSPLIHTWQRNTEENKDEYFQTEIGKKPYIVFAAKLHGLNWKYFRFLAKADALPQMQKIHQGNLLLIGLLCLFLASLALYYLVRIYLPYKILQGGFHAIHLPQSPQLALEKIHHLVDSNKQASKQDDLQTLLQGQEVNLSSFCFPLCFLLISGAIEEDIYKPIAALGKSHSLLPLEKTSLLVLEDFDTCQVHYIQTFQANLQRPCLYFITNDTTAIFNKLEALRKAEKVKFMFKKPCISLKEVQSLSQQDFSIEEMQKLYRDLKSLTEDAEGIFLQSMATHAFAGFENIAYALKYLDSLLTKKLNTDALPAKVISEALEKATNWQAIYTLFAPKINKLRELIHKTQQNKSNDIVQNIEQYIQTHLAHNTLSTSAIADACGLSAPYVRKQFLDQRGISIQQYINDKRMELAKAYLQDSSFTIEQIAEKIGMDNVKYFYTLFKKKYTQTPKQYREGMQKNETK